MNNEWFFIKQREEEQWIKLLTTRKVDVIWDTSNTEDLTDVENLPRTVTVPKDIDLTNEDICDYLSNEYGYCVSDWWVSE